VDERIDILTEDGNYTGKTALKSEAHKHGWFHNTVHVWCFTKAGYILLQQRGARKKTFPLCWDVSVAGHVGAGEDIQKAALREIKEEIGYTTSKNYLEKIGVFKAIQKQHPSFIDCEYHHTFLCEITIPLAALKKQDTEVAALKFISIHQYRKELRDFNISKLYVPHDMAYYEKVLLEIEERL